MGVTDTGSVIRAPGGIFGRLLRRIYALRHAHTPRWISVSSSMAVTELSTRPSRTLSPMLLAKRGMQRVSSQEHDMNGERNYI
eukprot:6210234-Pleurochrysis_carterae.AAC.1